jgi:murein DD-endopeptidase MepM/ murein hydrolase activator NlpD
VEIQSPIPKEPQETDISQKKGRFLSLAAWLLALSLVGIALYLGWRAVYIPAGSPHLSVAFDDQPANLRASQGGMSPNLLAAMPEYSPTETSQAILRRPELHTIIPSRPRQEVITYTVQKGDSVFEIAKKFNLKPETVLWGNYAQLNDNPDLISVGMQLRIPPVDGVLYEFQEGDSLEAVAARFEANVEEILNWPGNRLDLSNPQVEPGTLLIVPGGHREFRQWLIPTIPRGSAGVSSSVYGAGACTGSYEGAYGSGTFVWPAGNHILSGNDYWPGHLGIDIAAGDGAPIYAADSGVVVFAGWANGGYGNTVMIDHGNGYQTLYAHMKSVAVRCGQSVSQGGVIGYAGSTGNSTGTHLHFEVRYLGGFVSPWFVLPAP